MQKWSKIETVLLSDESKYNFFKNSNVIRRVPKPRLVKLNNKYCYDRMKQGWESTLWSELAFLGKGMGYILI